MNLPGDAVHLSLKVGLHDFLQVDRIHFHNHRLAHQFNQNHDPTVPIGHSIDPFDASEGPVGKPDLLTRGEQRLGIRLHSSFCCSQGVDQAIMHHGGVHSKAHQAADTPSRANRGPALVGMALPQMNEQITREQGFIGNGYSVLAKFFLGKDREVALVPLALEVFQCTLYLSWLGMDKVPMPSDALNNFLQAGGTHSDGHRVPISPIENMKETRNWSFG